MSGASYSAPLHTRRPLVLADLVPGAFARDALLVVAGAGLTGLLAQIALPVAGSPVPVTGQTLGALLVASALGWQRGMASMMLYLVVGMAGMPWFAAQTSGFHMPSLGYVIGFVAAAGVVGALASRGGDRSPLPMVGTMILGNAIIYLFGLGYLMWDLHLGLGSAWEIGMRSFLLGDALKIAIAAGLVPVVWRGLSAWKRD